MRICRFNLRVLKFASAGLFVVSVTFVVAVTTPCLCFGGTVVEDFSDGDATDGSPLEWHFDNPAGSGRLVDGAFRLDGASNTCCPSIYTVLDEYTDIHIETSVQFLSDANMFAFVGFRGQHDKFGDGLWAGVQGDGELGIGIAQNGVPNATARGVFLPPGTVRKDAEITFRVDAVDDNVILSAWETGEDMETATQVEWTNSRRLFPTGNAVNVSLHPYGNPSNELDILSIAITPGPTMPEGGAPALLAGDSDQDLDFDQLDLVQVQIAAKYLTGQTATWGEGDWNGAPGGSPGNPPIGNSRFDQIDIIAALSVGTYLTGPYAALAPGGSEDDEQTSLVYDSSTGDLSVNAPASTELTSIFVTSAGNLFVGDKPAVLDGPFDSFGPDNIFKSTIGGSFGDSSFGNVLPAGLSKADVAADLSASGSLVGGGGLGDVDLVYVPEPRSALLIAMGMASAILLYRRES